MRQSKDSEFPQILNRIRKGSHTDDDVREIKSLTDIDTSHWPNGFVKVYLTYCVANIGNERCIEKLRKEFGRDVSFTKVKYSARDKETQTLCIYF